MPMVVTQFALKIPQRLFRKFPSISWVLNRPSPLVSHEWKDFFFKSFLATEKLDPIDREIQALNNGLRKIENEQNYMIDRERIHHQSKRGKVQNMSAYCFSRSKN